MAEITKIEEMKDIICKCMQDGLYQEARDCISIYKRNIGVDQEIIEFEEELNILYPPKIAVICIDCMAEQIDTFIANQKYNNMEVVETTSGEELLSDVQQYAHTSDSDYITFLLPQDTCTSQKLKDMVTFAEKTKLANIILCTRNIVDAEGTIIAHADKLYEGALKNQLFQGEYYIESAIQNGANIYGDLSTVLVKTFYVRDCQLEEAYHCTKYAAISKIVLLYELLISGVVAVMEESLVNTKIAALDMEEVLRQQRVFVEYVRNLVSQRRLNIVNVTETVGLPGDFARMVVPEKKPERKIKREMTFYYTDKGEYYNLEPIAKEAERRGIKIKYTNDLLEESEIGVYCQHFSHPEKAKFSMVLLHDMAQGHNRWPNLWELERWNIYDIGIVPGSAWGERWSQCGSQYYTNARHGVYEMGYPKSDYTKTTAIMDRAQELKEQLRLPYEKTILYAPSWENDDKEDDFVKALASMKVNLLIKQAVWPEAYASVILDIEKQRKMHEGQYDNLHFIEPEESILVALAMSDMVVSDESSVMTEALMYGVPSLAITDWLIPDSNPKRFASVPMDYVFKKKKVEMREYVEKILEGNQYKHQMEHWCDENFSNVGNSSSDIMDCVEYYALDGKKDDFKKLRLASKYMPVCLWN